VCVLSLIHFTLYLSALLSTMRSKRVVHILFSILPSIFTHTKKVMFSSVLDGLLVSFFVCLFISRIVQKLLNRLSRYVMERWHTHMGHGRQLHFGCNPDHSTLGLQLLLGDWVHHHTLHPGFCVTRHVRFTSINGGLLNF